MCISTFVLLQVLEAFLLVGQSLLLLGGRLLGSRLLSSGLLGSGLLGSRLLGSGLLGGLLGSGLLGDLLGSGLLCLGLLSSGLLGDLLLSKLVRSSSLAGSLGLLEVTSSNCPLEGHADVDSGLGGINLVVGADVLEDGLAGGASPVLQGCDGGSNHDRVLGVGSRDLGLGGLLDLRGSGGGSSHVDVLW